MGQMILKWWMVERVGLIQSPNNSLPIQLATVVYIFIVFSVQITHYSLPEKIISLLEVWHIIMTNSKDPMSKYFDKLFSSAFPYWCIIYTVYVLVFVHNYMPYIIWLYFFDKCICKCFCDHCVWQSLKVGGEAAVSDVCLRQQARAGAQEHISLLSLLLI